MRYVKVKTLQQVREYFRVNKMTWDNSDDYIVYNLNKKNRDIWLVYENRKIVGYFAIQHDFRRDYLLELTIVKSKQGKGYGKKVMKFIIENCKFPIGLHVRASNHNAIKLYEGFGFYVEKIVKKYYDHNGTAYYMRLK